MSEHFIERCADCKVVISQCRCPSPGKTQRWGLCAACKKIREEINIPTNVR